MASAVNLPWNWVVESLANFKQVDPSTLIELVKRTPGISDDLGKNAREMVSLRILEGLFPRRNGITTDVGSAPNTKINFEPTESCEDALHHILHKTLRSNGSTELENSKWDVQPFIMQKRSSLPKCALQQLKEAILKGSHPLLASLKERSGLIVADKSENRDSVVDVPEKEILMNPGIRDDEVQGDYLNTNLLRAHRVQNESATEITTKTPGETSCGFLQHTQREDCNFSKEPRVEGLQESRSPDGGDDDHVSSKKLKRHSSESNPAKKLKVDPICMQPTVNLNSVMSEVTARTEDPSGGLIQHVQTEVCDLSKEPCVGLEESRFSGGVHDQHVASKMLRQSCDHSNHGKKLNQDSCYTNQTVNVDSASSQATELIEDPSGGFVQNVQKEECNFSIEQVEGLEESRFPDDCHGEFVASKKLRQSCNTDDAMLHNQVVGLEESRFSGGVHDQHVASKMLRQCCDHSNHGKNLNQDSFTTNQTVNLDSASSQATELIEGPSGGFVQHVQREGCNFSIGRVEGLEESRFPDDCHGEFVASKKLRQSCNTDDAMLHNQQQIPHNEDNVPREMSGNGQSQMASVFKDGSDELRELKSCYKSTHSVKNNIQANRVNMAAACKAKDILDHNHDLLTKKHAFLSSQCTYIEDSMETIDLTEVNFCVRCNEGGQMLVCSSEVCPLAVHESCLGSATTFDGNGKFYCPICTYSRAILMYKEAKRKVLSARKDLEAFVGCGSKCIKKQPSEGFSRSVQNQPGQQHFFEKTEANDVGNNINTIDNPRCRSFEENMVIAEPSGKGTAAINKEGKTLLQKGQPPRELEEQQIAGPKIHIYEFNTSSIGMGTGHVANETNCGLTGDELEGQTLQQECEPPRELEEQQIVRPVFRGCKPITTSSLGKDIGHVANETNCSMLQDKLEGQKVGQECQSPSSFKGKEICRGSYRGSEVQLQNTVLNHQVTDIPHEISLEEEDHKPVASKISTRSHKQKPKYTYPAITSLRRNVIPWTSLEEKTLKDGMQRFSNVNDKVFPWKKILDFGSSVFQNRTAVDLKDKWRNICKGNTKPKLQST